MLGLSDKQKALRPTGIGASEIAAVVGLHPARKPIDVYLDKMGASEPLGQNPEVAPFLEWGHRIERVVAEAWAERHPDVSIFTPPTLRHPTCSIAFATPDRVVVPQGRRARELWMKLLEIKNVSSFQAGSFGEGADEIPEHMLLQVQWQLEVVGLEEAALVPLIGGHDFREYPIRRDRELGSMLIESAERFWRDHVQAEVPPPVDGSESYGAFLRTRYPREKQPLLPLTPEAVDLVSHLRDAKAALKAAEETEAALSQSLKALLGEAAGIEGLCTWKANKDGTKTDWEALARSLGADAAKIAQFTSTKPGARVLRLVKE